MKKGKFALVVNVAKLDVKVYGNDGALPGTKNDSRHMSDFLRKQGYQVTTLDTEEVTVENFENYIESKRKTKGKLIIYYSGHGTQVWNDDSTEDDRLDEAWCFYNGLYTDKRLHSILYRLHGRLNVILLSDSCHSDSMLKGVGHSDLVPKSINTNNVEEKFIFSASIKNKHPKVLAIAGCLAYETSMEMTINGIRQGNFTHQLLSAYQYGLVYNDVYRILAKKIAYQSPQLSYLGKGYNIKRQKAFR